MQRRFEDRKREDQAKSRDHREIGSERGKPHLFRRVSQRNRRHDVNAQGFGAELNGRGGQGLAATCSPRWLAVNRAEFMPRRNQRIEARHRKIRGSHEDDFHEETLNPLAEGIASPYQHP